MRVAVIGARCRHQGIGAHLARFCAQWRHEVCGLLGTTKETVAEASDALAEATGQRAPGFTRLRKLLRETRPEALVIASPHESHGAYLEAALDAGLHVLCEKPLVWGGEDPAAEAEALAEAFLAAGLHLRVNAQWPTTLPAYRALFHPQTGRIPTTFSMHLAPRSRGIAMLPDALPHALSLLAAVLPGREARLEHIAVDGAEPDSEDVRVSFDYCRGTAAIQSRVHLTHGPEQPRPASYGFDGRIAHRDVALEGYHMSFVDGEKRIPLSDPTRVLVGSFFEAIAKGPPTAVDPAAVPGMRHLAEVVAAASPDRNPSPS
jgi:predicted dehydrogenase